MALVPILVASHPSTGHPLEASPAEIKVHNGPVVRSFPAAAARPAMTDLMRPPPGGFAGPVKRSITIAGHQTSISLEPVFWRALETAARTRGLPLSALVAEIDALRVAQPTPPNLGSTLRSWLLHHFYENYSQ